MPLSIHCAACKAPFFELIPPPEELAAAHAEFRERGQLSRRDLPLPCVIVGSVAAALSVFCLMDHEWEILDVSRSENIAGRVASIEEITERPYGKLLRLEVDEPFRRRHLVQFDLRPSVPTLNDLRLGESVEVLAQKDAFQKDADWYHEIRAGGQTLLAYEDTVRILSRSERLTGYLAGGISIVLLMLGITVRVVSGRWMKEIALESPQAPLAVR